MVYRKPSTVYSCQGDYHEERYGRRAEPCGDRREGPRDRRPRGPRRGDDSAHRAGVRRDTDGPLLARPEQGRAPERRRRLLFYWDEATRAGRIVERAAARGRR